MNTFDITFTAGQTLTLPGGKQFLLLVCGSDITVEFLSTHNKPIEKAEGIKSGFRTRFDDRFIGVKLYSATAQTIKVGITDGDAEYNRSSGDVNADIAASTFEHKTSVTIATVTSSLIIAANNDRKEVVITSLASNGDTVYLGGSGVDDEEGIPLEPGDDYALTTKGAIYGYNSDTSDASILIAEME